MYSTIAMSQYTTHQIDGWNPTQKNGDEWGMVYGIAIPIITMEHHHFNG